MNEYKEIPLKGGRIALVSPEDYEKVSQWKWHTAPKRLTHVYAMSSLGGRGRGHVFLHRFILDAPKGMTVDHINGDTLNCTRENLRLATQSQNIANQKKRSKSGYKGVTVTKKGQIISCISSGPGMGSEYLGTFKNLKDAAAAYDNAARKRFGKFARLNFPKDGERGAL